MGTVGSRERLNAEFIYGQLLPASRSVWLLRRRSYPTWEWNGKIFLTNRTRSSPVNERMYICGSPLQRKGDIK